MREKRKIREKEIMLISFLLNHLKLKAEDYPISGMVDEYEDGKMGSIGLGNEDAVYKADLIQVDYIDSDNIPVVISLTTDTNNNLLDLDFWKSDFSKLIAYPEPGDLIFRTPGSTLS